MVDPRQIHLKARNFLSGQSLASRAARGTLWIGAGSGIDQGARFVRNLILTRILAPEAFGLMGILLATNALLEAFAEIGVRQAVIQNPRSEERAFLNAAWWFSVLRAVVLYAMGFIAAPWVAKFYGNPDLLGLLRLIFVSMLLRGTISPNTWVALKRMRYRHWAVIMHGGAVVGVVTTLVLVLFIQNVTALVAGFLAETVAILVLSYILCPFRPGIRFDKALALQLLKYAGGMIGFPILSFVFLRADIFVVAKLCPVTMLGLYTMALRLARIPEQASSRLLPQIAMPAFAEMQNDHARLNKVLLRLVAIVLGLGLPAVAFCLLYGRQVLGLVWGEPYAAMGLAFGMATATSILHVIGLSGGQVCFALGRPDLYRLYAAVRAGVLVLIIYPATKRFGPAGAAAAVLSAATVATVFQVGTLSRLTGVDLRRFLASVLAGASLSLPVLLAWWLTHAPTSERPLLALGIGVGSCAVSAGLGALVLKKNALARKE